MTTHNKKTLFEKGLIKAYFDQFNFIGILKGTWNLKWLHLDANGQNYSEFVKKSNYKLVLV